MTVIGTAEVAVAFDTRAAAPRLKQELDATSRAAGTAVEQNLTAAAQRTGTAVDRHLGESFKKVGGQASKFITLPVVAFLGLSTKAAAEEGQEMAVLANNLRQAAGATDTQIAATEKFITKTQNATGVSDGQLRPALARLVQATKDVGLSQELLGIALDVSKARGLDVTQVATGLGRAYMGNTAALGRLGVATKDAEGKALSFKEIVGQLAEATGGTAARAADTAAGRAQILRARFADLQEDIGTKLLPTFERVAGAVGGIITVFDKLPSSAQNVLVVGLVAAAAAGPVLRLVGTVITLQQTMVAASAGGGLLASVLPKLGIAAGIAVGVVGLVVALQALDKKLEEVSRGKADIDAVAGSLLDLAKNGNVALKSLADTARIDLKDVDRAFEALTKRTTDWGAELSDVDFKIQQTGARKELKKELDDVDRALAQLVQGGASENARKALEALAEQMGRTPEQLLPFLDNYTGAVKKAEVSTKLTTAAQKESAAASGEQGDALDGLADDVEKPKSAFELLNEEISKFSQVLEESLGVQLGAEEATSRYRDRIDALRESIKENGTKTGTATEKQRELAGSLRDAVEAAQAEVEALTRNGQITADTAAQKAALVERLNTLRATFPALAPVIDTYIAKVQATNVTTTTTVTTDLRQATTSLSAFEAMANFVARDRTATLRLLTEGSGGPGRPAARQHGGRFGRGVFQVGEAGRELVFFDQPGFVVNNGDTERILAALNARPAGPAVATVVPAEPVVKQYIQLVAQPNESTAAQARRAARELAWAHRRRR